MARESFPIKPALVVDHTTELVDWIEAISTFQTYYTHLHSCAIEGRFQQGKNCQYDQFPMDQLNLLLSAMQTELEELIRDMDLSDPFRLQNNTQIYSQLANHTRNLNQLNQRAQTMMQLSLHLLPCRESIVS